MDRVAIEANHMTPLVLEPTTQYAYRFFHEGELALADLEYNGIHIDTRAARKAHKKVGREIKDLKRTMDGYEAVQIWKKLYGHKFKLDSDPQLKAVLFTHKKGLKLESEKETGSGQKATDAEALKKLDYDQDFISDLIMYRKKKKLKNTYLKNLIRETVNGVLHSFFHLHIARTYRSSSSKVNFQNMPIRDPYMGEIIRSLIFASPGNHLVEIDYSGIEVTASTWYHKDPNMLNYIADPTTDMHLDMAVQLYKMDGLNKKNKAEKEIRKCAKNSFVFPQFYGDYFIACARNLWSDITTYNLRLADGTPLKKHLKEKGIHNYKQFEKHIQKVEGDFWGRRFRKYDLWKDKVWNAYQKTGTVHLLNGFVCSGLMTKNEVTNYPIQGVAFHTLLWSLIEINRILKTEGWKSKLIGQIHDAIVADVPPEELQDFLGMCNRVMTKDILKAWPFIITELEVEADYTEVDRPWSEKKGIELPKAA